MDTKRIMAKVIILIIMFCSKNYAEEEFQAIVAQDGSGNYTSISQAVKAAPSHSPTSWSIQRACVCGQDKQNLAFIGEGIDVTIITDNETAKTRNGTSNSATVEVKGSNFIGKYITFNNSAGPDSGQAVALKVSINYSAFYKCKINGYQDTLLVETGYQFFRESIIVGTVDFIFGAAPVVFQNCEINVHNRSGSTTALTAQGRDKNTIGKSAFSFHNCSIEAAEDFNSNSSLSTFLRRSWKDHATVVFMESFSDFIIDPLGWTTMTDEPVHESVFYGEYKNFGPGANMSKKVGWAKPGKLTNEQAQEFSVRNLIQENDWLPSVEIPYMLDLINNQSD